MRRGAVKLCRQQMEQAIWRLPPGQFKVWVLCLLLANHDPASWWDGREEVEIPRLIRHLPATLGVGSWRRSHCGQKRAPEP